MSAIVVILHVIVCLALILIVLLQTGKGADMGAAFGGGGSQTLFGSTGASTFLSKATTIAAIVFMVTCFTLAYMSTNQRSKSIITESETIEVTAVPQAEKNEMNDMDTTEGAKAEDVKKQIETSEGSESTSSVPADSGSQEQNVENSGEPVEANTP